MSNLQSDILEIVYKHLPGKHNQASHGRRGGASMSPREERISNYKKWPRSHRISQIKYLKNKLSSLGKNDRPDYRKQTEQTIRELEESLR